MTKKQLNIDIIYKRVILKSTKKVNTRKSFWSVTHNSKQLNGETSNPLNWVFDYKAFKYK